MEIAGQRLFFPRNFLYLSRLPARFEILVVARGAAQPKGVAFELEISGQRLVLNSKAELKVGARYELEKISATEFKLLRQVTEREGETIPSLPVEKNQKDRLSDTNISSIINDVRSLPQDLLALKLIGDESNPIARTKDKYAFNWENSYSLSGVFVPIGDGKYSLFIAGTSAGENTNIEELAILLNDLGVEKVHRVSHGVLATIAAGAIDLQT